MSSLWTNAEVLYSMPAVGATKASTTQSLVTSTTAYQLPALNQLWTPSQMVGKAFQFQMGGTYDATAVGSTLGLYFDSTEGSVGTLIAGSGAVTVVSSTTGSWNANVWMTCISVGSNTSGWVTTGDVLYGTGNNAGTAGAAAGMMGGANALGIPSSLAIPTNVSYFPELWSTWASAPTAFVCSQFVVLAMN